MLNDSNCIIALTQNFHDNIAGNTSDSNAYPEDDIESKEDELDAWESRELSSSSSNSPSVSITPATAKPLAEPLTKPFSEPHVSLVYQLISAEVLRNVSVWPDLETGSWINGQAGQRRDGKSETVNTKDFIFHKIWSFLFTQPETTSRKTN